MDNDKTPPLGNVQDVDADRAAAWLARQESQQQDEADPLDKLQAQIDGWDGKTVEALPYNVDYCDYSPLAGTIPEEYRGKIAGGVSGYDNHNSLANHHHSMKILAIDEAGKALVHTEVWDEYTDGVGENLRIMPKEAAFSLAGQYRANHKAEADAPEVPQASLDRWAQIDEAKAFAEKGHKADGATIGRNPWAAVYCELASTDVWPLALFTSDRLASESGKAWKEHGFNGDGLAVDDAADSARQLVEAIAVEGVAVEPWLTREAFNTLAVDYLGAGVYLMPPDAAEVMTPEPREPLPYQPTRFDSQHPGEDVPMPDLADIEDAASVAIFLVSEDLAATIRADIVDYGHRNSQRASVVEARRHGWGIAEWHQNAEAHATYASLMAAIQTYDPVAVFRGEAVKDLSARHIAAANYYAENIDVYEHKNGKDAGARSFAFKEAETYPAFRLQHPLPVSREDYRAYFGREGREATAEREKPRPFDAIPAQEAAPVALSYDAANIDAERRAALIPADIRAEVAAAASHHPDRFHGREP